MYPSLAGCENYVGGGSSDCSVYDSGKHDISRLLSDGDFYRISLPGMRYDKSAFLFGNRRHFCLCADASLGNLDRMPVFVLCMEPLCQRKRCKGNEDTFGNNICHADCLLHMADVSLFSR